MDSFGEIDVADVEVLLCDADGNLFPSEEPAFVASCGVVNRLMAELGVERRFEPEELRLATTGMNFRTTAAELAAQEGVAVQPGLLDPTGAAPPRPLAGRPELSRSTLERWVTEERRRVTAHLAATLRPDPDVSGPLRELSERFTLATVSSSASSRLEACFEATELAELIPADLRFSAEDSLPTPTSKPDPAVYALAAQRLGIDPTAGLAIEDSTPGVRSAVAAGFPTIGNVAFVPRGERQRRSDDLRSAGAGTVISSWHELRDLMARDPRAAAAERYRATC